MNNILFFICLGTERYKTCDEVLQLTPSSTNGIYRIFPNPSSSESTDVYCNMVEGGWTVRYFILIYIKISQ